MDINTRREEAAAAFAVKGLPTVKEEAWRFTNVSRLNDETFDASWQAATVSFDPLSDLVVVFRKWKMVDRGIIFRWIARWSTSAFNYGLCGRSIGYTGR